MTRRGFTLFEMLVALVVGAVVLVTALRVELALARAVRGRAERAGAAGHLRAAAGLLRFEAASLGSDSLAGPDLGTVGPARLVFRAHRGLVSVCTLGADSVVLAGRLGSWRPRAPVPVRDSLLLLVPGAGATGGWQAVALVAGPTAAVCPGGELGASYRIGLDSVAAARLAGRPATVGRVFEAIAIEAYGSGTSWHLGQEGLSGGASLQPVVGPLDGSTGFVAAGWDRAGLPVAATALIDGLAVVLRVRTGRELAVGPGAPRVGTDSVSLSLRLGNRP